LGIGNHLAVLALARFRQILTDPNQSGLLIYTFQLLGLALEKIPQAR
jgi:hypothetical protein